MKTCGHKCTQIKDKNNEKKRKKQKRKIIITIMTINYKSWRGKIIIEKEWNKKINEKKKKY